MRGLIVGFRRAIAGVSCLTVLLLAGCSTSGPEPGENSEQAWSTFQDKEDLFSTELPSSWRSQTFTQDVDPNYPIERGVFFATADSPVLAAIAENSGETDPAAIGEAVESSPELFIGVFVSRSNHLGTPQELAVNQEMGARSLPSYRLITLEALSNVDGYRFSYAYERDGVPVTVDQVFVPSDDRMLFHCGRRPDERIQPAIRCRVALSIHAADRLAGDGRCRHSRGWPPWFAEPLRELRPGLLVN
jgi:hypothetical protein